MIRIAPLALLATVAWPIAAAAQTVDTTVCDILANPAAFNGKIVRIKCQVIQGFEEFTLHGGACNQDVNAIWLSYPEGSKAKAGPTVSVSVQPSRNSTIKPAAVPERSPVKLEKNKDFKQFDSALADSYTARAGLCLGCGHNAISATLVGRVDGVDRAGMLRDTSGRVVEIQGFGHLNRYRARLVLQRASDVEVRPIDLSNVTAKSTDRQNESAGGDPVRAVKEALKAFPTNSLPRERLQAAAAAFGNEGEENGVIVGFGKSNEVPSEETAKAGTDSPDGLVIRATFDMERLKDSDALSTAITHVGTHVADIRDARKTGPNGAATPFNLEWRAWESTVWRIMAAQRGGLILPGGFIAWSASWSQGEARQLADQNITQFLTGWSCLKETTPHNPWQD